MSVSGINSPTSKATIDRTGNAFASLSSDQFIKVMISELRNQDPLEPQDSGKMLEQLSSLRNIESQMSLQEQLKALVMQSQLSSAGSLIGKVVTGLDANNNAMEGLVTSVRVQEDKVMLELDSGKSLDMDRVTRVAALAA